MLTFTLALLAIIFGSYVAWSIGANDVANAVGTSVGSGALTLKKAVIIAAIFEFLGAFFLGSHVSETLEGGIVNPSLFSHNITDYVLGMLAALLATGLWLQVASYFGCPVSTTHSIVGAVLGFGLVLGGVKAIFWGKIFSIAFSWIISPLLGGAIAYMVFSLIRHKILYKANPVAAIKKLSPFFAFAIFFIFTWIILFNGLPSLNLKFSIYHLLFIACALGFVASMIAFFLVRNLSSSLQQTETIFAYFQILTACFMALAHGSNDVANAIGPLSAIINVLRGHSIVETNTVPTWLLFLGGGGIVLGLATWGWRVIETIGKKLIELTPSRGFAAEISAAFTIVFASKLGLPISTTHVLVGSVLGVGLARGIKALNLNTVRDIAVSWVLTVPAGALLSIFFFYMLKMLIPAHIS